MGPFCSDCGGHLEKVPDKYLKEGTVWYKCQSAAVNGNTNTAVSFHFTTDQKSND